MPSRASGQHGSHHKFGRVMREFYHHHLHSGSKRGPIVTSVRQAKAIAAHESGMARRR